MKQEQFWKLDIETLRWLHQKNLITATAYVLGIIRATRSQGWKWTFKVAEFCQEWQVSERSFYRAISFLKTNNLIDWRVKGEIVIWWSENPPTPDQVIALPHMAEQMTQVAEPLPHMAEQMTQVAEPLPHMAKKTAESFNQQGLHNPNRYLTDFLTDSLTDSLTDIALTPIPHLEEEREKREKEFGFQLPREEATPIPLVIPLEVQDLQPPPKPSTQATVPAAASMTKYDPALGIRPPRQKPRFRYPDGPWLIETGQINEDFIRDRANLWRTGNNENSKSFGAMTMEDVMGLVATHYQRVENHAKLEIDWSAYVAKNQRYVNNMKLRLDAGISIKPTEQEKIISKVPAVTSELVETAYGTPAKIQMEQSLPSASIPQLESVCTVPKDIWDAVAAATQKEERSATVIPQGAESPSAYTTIAKPEDSEYFRRLSEERRKARENKKTSKTQPISNLQDINSQVKFLAVKKALPPTLAERETSRKLAHWNSLLQTGVDSVIADVQRQVEAQGYQIVDGQATEVDF